MKTPKLSAIMSNYLIAFWAKDVLDKNASLLLYKTAKENHYIFAGFCLSYGISLAEFNILTKEEMEKEKFWDEVDSDILDYLSEEVLH